MRIILKEIANIKFCVSPPKPDPTQGKTKWLACPCFLQDNTLKYEPDERFCVADKNALIQADDIVIKRIAPAFVNYIDTIPVNTYAGNNLIVITPSAAVYPKYLAMILNDRISVLTEESSVGAVMKSVSRVYLENMEIPLIPFEKQKLVGDVWGTSIELKKMKTRLIELECIRESYRLNKYLDTIGG